MNLAIMCQPTFRVRLPWLAAGLLLTAATGCSSNDSSTANPTPTPTSLSVRSSRLIEGTAVPATPSPGAGAAAGEAAPVADAPSVSADAEPESGGAPLTVTFTAEVEGGPPELHYRWDFGDNTPPARELRVEHTYQHPGEYEAIFSVTGTGGIEESRNLNIEVTEEGLDFNIETDSDVGPAPLTVEFTARMDDDDEDAPATFYFQWDFGDGSRDVSNPTTHTYKRAGTYTATATVTNAKGQRATRDVEITVDAPEDEAQEEG